MTINKIKISDVAKEFQLTSKEFLSKLLQSGVKISSKTKTMTEEQVKEIRNLWATKEASLTETMKGDILEKRVRGSVIRRRKMDTPSPETEEKISPKVELSLHSQPIKEVTKPTLEPEKESPKVKTVESSKIKAVAVPESVAERKVPKINVVAPSPIPPETPKPLKAEEGVRAKELGKETEELASKRKKAFLKKRGEEFDLTGFSRMERVFQTKKKKILDKSKMRQTSITVPKANKRQIRILETISVSDLSDALKIKVSEVIKKLVGMGMMVTANQRIDADTAVLVASEYGFEVKVEIVTEELLLKREEPEPQDLLSRPPVVTVMGHVDHGKTTLLDAIRKTHVAEGEAGGITQHIGASMVTVGNRTITFIDTPGHEAFSAMRARGAKTTDIVILVVAADDGVMPQTKEAIAHAKESGVPIVVALNKVDKPGAQVERIKKELSELELVSEDWGGKTIYVEVSAKTQKGIKELLELILLQADVLELKASPKLPAQGVVLEAKLEKGLGPVATVLVQQGTLRRGDVIVSGTLMGKVKLLKNDRGQLLKEAPPSFAVEVSGLEGVPGAGDFVYVFRNEEDAKKLVEWRINKVREKEDAPIEKVTLEGLYEKMKEASLEELKFVVKADVQGSVEVVKQTIEKLTTDKVKMKVIYTGVGAITESDVNLATTSKAILVGFNIRPDSNSRELVKNQKIDLRLYTIIYDLVEDLKKAMIGRLAPSFKEAVIGRVEVRNVFNISKIGTIAGCYVTEGKVTRQAQVRLLRDSKVVYTGKIASLKRFKNDAREVEQNFECGISIENYNDIKQGDVIEAFIVEEVPAVA